MVAWHHMRSVMTFRRGRLAIVDGLPLVNLFPDRLSLETEMGPNLIRNLTSVIEHTVIIGLQSLTYRPWEVS